MRTLVGCSLICVAACGGGGYNPTGSGGGGPPPSGQVQDVSMMDNTFSPATPTVKVGTTVKWTNHGSTSHTTTSDATPQIWTGTVAPAGSTTCPPGDPYCTPGSTPPGTYSRLFSTAGTYGYHCEVHRQLGMTGTITVTP